MKRIVDGSVVVLIMDVKDTETPFFAEVGSAYTAMDVVLDPKMPSGYAVKLMGYGSPIFVDRSAVVHYEDWKKIHNAVLTKALSQAKFL